MLKLKRLVGEVLVIDYMQDRIALRLQKIEGKKATLVITTIRGENDTFEFTLGDQAVRVHIENATSSSALVGIDAPTSVRIWRAELIGRSNQPGDQRNAG